MLDGLFYLKERRSIHLVFCFLIASQSLIDRSFKWVEVVFPHTHKHGDVLDGLNIKFVVNQFVFISSQ